MPTCKVVKNANFTTISNYHLRDKSLSMKAKGLLTIMLSLPEDWDYTIAGLATLSIDYYDLGYATGKMAAKILKGDSKIERMPIEYAATSTKKYNAEICEALGISAPEGYAPLG